MDRDTIFISHATPDDNDFVRWLSAKLTDRGYSVWADLLYLKGGTPFWTSIEDVLRRRAVKVVFVVSRKSVDPARSGVRNELSVADGLRRSLGDSEFIVPVRIDDTPFDELPIQIHQLNALDFSQDRDTRLEQLFDTLENANVPRPGRSGAPLVLVQGVAADAASRERQRPPSDTSHVDRIPSLAVLPFQNLSSDLEQDYFADGVVEDILTALSRFRTLRVAARNSSFVYKGRAVDIRQAGRELGVRYVLEGSVRKGGGRLRITAQLIDAANGAHLWGQSYDGALEDVFAFQDSITESVASIVEPTIVQAEFARARENPPANPDAYDLYLQALPKVLLEKPESAVEALDLLDRALALDPHFGRALGLATRASLPLLDNPLPEIDEAFRERAAGYARRALTTAGSDSQMRAFAGLSLIMTGSDCDTGLAALRRAASDNPHDVSNLGCAGVGELWAGDLGEATRLFRRVLTLNPHDPQAKWINNGLAHIAILEGRYEDALHLATLADSLDPGNEIVLWTLIAANVYLGRIGEARRWRERLQTISPSASISRLRAGQRLRDQSRVDVLVDALRTAGLPE